MKRMNAIYARQSVDRPDSISIESQIEFCQYELKGSSFKTYKDKGYSGKNMVRPQLQQLFTDIREGGIEKVIVYKLDRISRSILDFSNMMEMFQKYHVEFVSSTEKFDTSTPMGRAMLNICIVFAQLERETIQKRVTDAYYSRSKKGFRMGGKPPYGFRLEEIMIDGIHTKRLVEQSQEAQIVREIFSMYAESETSYGDITRYYTQKNVLFYGKELGRSMLAQLLRNPAYVRADRDIYQFFWGQGAEIVGAPEEFDGIHGCYLYRGKDSKRDKLHSLRGHMLVAAPHEGIVSSELWLSCRIKLMGNHTVRGSRRAANTWLAGKIKCGRCGYALMSVKSGSGRGYLRCTRRLDNKACQGCGKLYTADVEEYVYREIVKKFRGELKPAGYAKANENPEIQKLYGELKEIEKEISVLADALLDAGEALSVPINHKAEELEQLQQEKMDRILSLTKNSIAPQQLERVVMDIGNWEQVEFDEKRFVVDKLIVIIKAIQGEIEIVWKF